MNLTSIDTETERFAPGNMAPKIVCLTWAEEEGSGILIGEDIPQFVEAILDRTIEDPANQIITGSYIAYDMAGFCANYPHLTKKVFAAYAARAVLCTGVVERTLDIAEGRLNPDQKAYSLEPLAKKYLRLDLDKANSWRLRYGELLGVPLSQWPYEAVRYAVDDAKASLQLTRVQLSRARKMNYTLPSVPEDCYSDFDLRLMSNWGVETNKTRVEALALKTYERMDQLKVALTGHGLYSVTTPLRGKNAGVPQGHKSNKKMGEIVTRAFDGSPPMTPKGRISLAKITLTEIEDRAPEVADWMEFGRLEKSASTYIEKMRAPVLHARFNVIVNTGRTSSSSPNLHNQPRIPGVRECFEARPGYVFISCDFSSQEMRTWAQACQTILGYSRLAERFRENPDFDPHVAMAAQSLLRIPEEEAIARLKAKDPKVKADRQASKIANFGLPGGMGVDGLIGYARNYDGSKWAEPATCAGCALTASGVFVVGKKPQHTCFAAGIRNSWQETWPEAKDYFYHVGSLAGVREYQAKQVMLHSGMWRGGVGFTNGCNGYFQALAAVASKAALREVTRRCYTVESSWLYGVRPVIMIHDEIVAECREEYAHEAAMEMVDVMEEEMNKVTPDVPARAAPALMKNWAKGAEEKWEGGRLVSWN